MMAKIILEDGREVPIVKPHLGDQMEAERQMKALRKKYTTQDFMADLKLSGFNMAFSIFASLNRAGQRTSLAEVLELDIETLSKITQREPGDPEPAGEDDDAEVEGEQTSDPQSARTGDDDE